MISDEKLICRFLKGEGAAFDELVQRYQRSILGLAQKMTGDRTWAEDLFQEIFLRVYRSLPTLRDPSRFRGWLYTLSVRMIRRALSRRRESGVSYSLDTIEDPDPKTDLSFDEASRQGLRDAVLRLPTRQREVVLLRSFDGYAHREIASLLGVTEEAVRANYYQGLKRLKTWLKESSE